jgi:hemolysin III
VPPVPADRAEELANSVTHGIGLLLSIAGLSALVRISGASSIPQSTLGCTVYGAALTLLYAASTFYHACRRAGLKQLLLLFDHIGIYLLIAGTYTPLALIVLHGRLGSALLILVWAFALLGSVSKVRRFKRVGEDSPWSYVALAWMVLAGSCQIAVNVPPDEFRWLLAGALFYSMGLPFFLKHDRRFNHAIWHLFVLAGSVCHYRAVVGFVSPLC